MEDSFGRWGRRATGEGGKEDLHIPKDPWKNGTFTYMNG